MKSKNSHSSSVKTKITQDKLPIQNQNTSHPKCIQRMSSDIINSLVEMVETNLKFPKTKNSQKRNLSSPKSDTQEYKKNKPVFVTVNRYSSFATDDNFHALSEPHTNNTVINEDQSIKIKLPPPTFVRGILDLVEFPYQLIDLISSKTFIFKLYTNNLKIQTTKPEFYRETIYFLKENNAQYHTYQQLEDKALL